MKIRYSDLGKVSQGLKLLSVTVPCYNSQDYMEHCIAACLSGGEDVEILIVDDGSKDGTADIADRLQTEHPNVIRAIHQPNKGHGGAVMTGLKNASGLYFKVVDSDDWVDEEAFRQVLQTLRELTDSGESVDLMVSNYIYDKPSAKRKKAIHYQSALPENRILTWDDVGRFRKWENLLMHALIYRTEVLRDSGLVLPEHTFYVDNLYCSVPLASVNTLYYKNVDLYHYFIGREGQSVQEEVMIRRIDQQILVNKLMMEQIDLEHVPHPRQRETILHYHDMITAVTSILLTVSGTPENLRKREELWSYIQENHPWEYEKLRHGLFGRFLHLPGKSGRAVQIEGYRILNRIFNFN